MITLAVSLISFYTFFNLVIRTVSIQEDINNLQPCSNLMHLNQLEEKNQPTTQISNNGKFHKVVSSLELLPTTQLIDENDKNNIRRKPENLQGVEIKQLTTEPFNQYYLVGELKNVKQKKVKIKNTPYRRNKRDANRNTTKQFTTEVVNPKSVVSQTKLSVKESVVKSLPQFPNSTVSMIVTPTVSQLTSVTAGNIYSKLNVAPSHELSTITKQPGQDENGKSFTTKRVYRKFSINYLVGKPKSLKEKTSSMASKQGVEYRLTKINNRMGNLIKSTILTTKSAMVQASKKISLTQQHSEQLPGKKNLSIARTKPPNGRKSTTQQAGKKHRRYLVGNVDSRSQFNQLPKIQHIVVVNRKDPANQSRSSIMRTENRRSQLMENRIGLPRFTTRLVQNLNKSATSSRSGTIFRIYPIKRTFRSKSNQDYNKPHKRPKTATLERIPSQRLIEKSTTEQNYMSQLTRIRKNKAHITAKRIPNKPRFTTEENASSRFHRQFRLHRISSIKSTSGGKTSNVSNKSQIQSTSATPEQNNKLHLPRTRTASSRFSTKQIPLALRLLNRKHFDRAFTISLTKYAKTAASSQTHQASYKFHNQPKTVVPDLEKRHMSTQVPPIEQNGRPQFTSRGIPSFRFSSKQIPNPAGQKTTTYFRIGNKHGKRSVNSRTTTNQFKQNYPLPTSTPRATKRKKLTNTFLNRKSNTQDLTQNISSEQALHQYKSSNRRSATLAKSEHLRPTIKNRWIRRKAVNLLSIRSTSMPKRQKTTHGSQSPNLNGNGKGMISSTLKIKKLVQATHNTVQWKLLNHEIVMSESASKEEVEPLWYRMFSETEINATATETAAATGTDTNEVSVTTSVSADTVPSTVAYYTTIEKVVLEFTPNSEIISVNTTKLSPLDTITSGTTANIIDDIARSKVAVGSLVNNTSTLTPLFVKERARLEEYNRESLFARILRIFDKKASYQYYGFTVSVRLEGRTISSGCILNQETVLTVLETKIKVTDELLFVQILNSMQFSTRVGRQQESQREDVVKVVPLFDSHTGGITGSMVVLMKVQHLYEYGNSIYPAIINTTGTKGKQLVVAEWQRVSHGNDMDIPVTLIHYSVSISRRCARLFGKHAAKHMICVRRPLKNDSNYCGRLGSLLVQTKTNNVLGILTHPNCNRTAGFTPLKKLIKWINETIQSY